MTTQAAEEALLDFRAHHATNIDAFRIEELDIDPDVQRLLDPKWVRDRVPKFRPDGLGIFEISRRDSGMLHVIDGQHRRALCQAVNYNGPVVCQVYSGLTKADEAFLFNILNDRRTPSTVDTFRMEVESGDAVAVELNSLLERYGWTVRTSSSPFSFRAVSALKQVYRGWGSEDVTNIGICETVVSIITGAWDGEPAGMRAEIILGIGLVLIRHGSRARVDKITTGLHELPGGAKALSRSSKAFQEFSKGKLADAVATAIVNMSNADLPRKSDKLLPVWGS